MRSVRKTFMQSRPNSVTIDLRALNDNLKEIRGRLGKGTKLMGVVKSDAYGHGLVPVSRCLEKHGIDGLAVAHLHEALDLRNAGIGLPIMLLCGLGNRESCEVVVERDVTPVIYALDAAEMLDRIGGERQRPVEVYLKVDTGMGRLGVSYEDVERVFERFAAFTHLRVIGLTSHLSTADDSGSPFVKDQETRFERVVALGRAMGMDLRWNNLANSAGTAIHEASHFEMVRCGIMLYGGLPRPDFVSPVVLKPVMHFRAQVLQIRSLKDGTPISYGRTHYTRGDRKIGVLSAGYGDGVPRRISNRGYALIRGQRAPLVGTICMNLALCDVTHIPGVRAGDEAVMLGTQGNAEIRADDIARWAEAISYEVFCAIGQVNRREYRE